jgi:hypothetical protein
LETNVVEATTSEAESARATAPPSPRKKEEQIREGRQERETRIKKDLPCREVLLPKKQSTKKAEEISVKRSTAPSFAAVFCRKEHCTTDEEESEGTQEEKETTSQTNANLNKMNVRRILSRNHSRREAGRVVFETAPMERHVARVLETDHSFSRLEIHERTTFKETTGIRLERNRSTFKTLGRKRTGKKNNHRRTK